MSETVSILAMIRLMLYRMVLSDLRAACRAGKIDHRLIDILVIAVCAVIACAGVMGWTGALGDWQEV